MAAVMPSDRTASVTRNAVVFLAAVAGGAIVWLLKGILTPLVLAIFLMMLIDGLARLIEERVKPVPHKAAMPLALLICVLAFGATTWLLVENTSAFIGQLVGYGDKLQAVIHRLGLALGVQTPPTLDEVIKRLKPAQYLGSAAQSVQAILSDAVFVLIYVGFLIASTRGFKRKIITLFPRHDRREAAVAIFARIRLAVERYVWVQTVTGLMMAVGAWALMAAVGLDNALFWAFFIFVASYIPMIGAAAGVIGPALFALMQFDGYWQALALLAGLEAVFFVVGNVVLPRMQGDSLNLDPVVILLSLAFWGAIWGLPGAFLSSPLTVMVMIILAQFPSTRWIAVLLSEDGEPGLDRASGRPA
jgi:predicted PurR-regulated permease PerM